MGTRDVRVDAYIERSADFAKPILEHLREIVHRACPDVEETMKWNTPTFLYHGLLCGMAAFKRHCTFGFWKSALVLGDNGDPADASFGDSGRVTTLTDLPPDTVLAAYIVRAANLNEQGVKVPRKKAAAGMPVAVPDDLARALAANPEAAATFERFSPSHKREYVEWITEAKREDTRRRRLDTTIQWLTEGKPRNWKYM